MFRYTPFLDDPDFHVHEVDVGSPNAGVLRKPDFDTTLGPERLFLSHSAPKSWADAKKAFNVGLFRIAADGMPKVFEPGIINQLPKVTRRSPSRSTMTANASTSIVRPLTVIVMPSWASSRADTRPDSAPVSCAARER